MRIEVDDDYSIGFYSDSSNVDIFLKPHEMRELFDKIADEFDYELNRPAWYYQ